MTPWALAISGALLQFIWQGFLVLLLTWVVAFLLRKQQPNIRYLVFCIALLALAALPVITAGDLYDPLAANVSTRHPAITLTIRGVWNGSVAPASLAIGKWLNASQPWALRIWLVGVAFLSVRLVWLASRVRSLCGAGKPADQPVLNVAAALARRMRISRAVRILVSAVPDGPSVAGWFRPVILLPAAAILNLTPDQLEAVLAHEMAHLRRYDDIVNIAQSMIETLLFYHPAVWWVSGRIRHERELCCDDLAVSASAGAICYARALTALEALRVSAAGLTLGAIGSSASSLEYRIRRIVGLRAQNYSPSPLPGLLALGLTLASIAIYSNPAHGFAPAPLPNAAAAYPESARAQGIQGTVPVEVKIDNVGRISAAKAIGGPRELRQAAVQSASTLRFSPMEETGTQQVDVAFQLRAPTLTPAPSTPEAQPPRAVPGSLAPNWRDNGESAIGLAAKTENDPAKKLDLLEQWEQLYPGSEFKAQRALMMAQALLVVLSSAYGKTDPAVLDAGRKAAQQFAEHFNEYLDDSLKPDALTPEQWAAICKTSELQIHTLLAWIAQTNQDDDTAEVELTKVLTLDPDQAAASWQLATTIIRKMAAAGANPRYSEALYDFARALAVTGPGALSPEARIAAESALKEHYAEWHGSEDGLKDLMTQAAGSAFPPVGFHIESIAEKPQDPNTLTFVIQNPGESAAAPASNPKHHTLLARIFMGISRLIHHLA